MAVLAEIRVGRSHDVGELRTTEHAKPDSLVASFDATIHYIQRKFRTIRRSSDTKRTGLSQIYGINTSRKIDVLGPQKPH